MLKCASYYIIIYNSEFLYWNIWIGYELIKNPSSINLSFNKINVQTERHWHWNEIDLFDSLDTNYKTDIPVTHTKRYHYTTIQHYIISTYRRFFLNAFNENMNT